MNTYSLLKKLVLPVSMIGLMAMSGCDSSDDSDSNGVAGIYSINTSGSRGGADGGSGSNANYVEISKFSNGALKVLSTGSADASFTMLNPSGNLGATPLTVSSDTTIDALAIGNTRPAAGTAYFIQNESRLYLSPGGGTIIGGGVAADGDIVTGIQIDSTATLTLALAFSSYAYLNLVNDIINQGTITTVDVGPGSRGALQLYASSYIADGSIDLAGNTAGQDGGWLQTGFATFFNSGDINTSGANDDATNNAGDGGYINMNADYFGQNSGNFNSSGGTATTAGNSGGYANSISLYSDWGYLHNSGSLMALGGNGDFAGWGSDVTLTAYASASGELLNSGDINTSGGDAAVNNGGNAGTAQIYAYGGRLVNNAAITSRGGSTTDMASNGGSANIIGIYHQEGGFWNANTPAIETLISGNFDSRGGDAMAGGSGNAGYTDYIEMYQNNSSEPEVLTTMKLLGYTDFTLNGGDGNVAGNANTIDIYQDWSDLNATSGDVLNEANITANGGNVSSGATTAPFQAGFGGSTNIETAAWSGSFIDSTKMAKNTGNFTANGGSGSVNLTNSWSTAGGNLFVYGYNGAENTGTIIASGGSDTGIDGGITGYGGSGANFEVASDNGTSRNSGDVTTNGGDGEYIAGNAGYLGVYGTDAINSGDFTANGGNADITLTDSRGGRGGWLELSSPTGDASQSGTVSITGGSGEDSDYGKDGSTMIGGFCTGPTC